MGKRQERRRKEREQGQPSVPQKQHKLQHGQVGVSPPQQQPQIPQKAPDDSAPLAAALDQLQTVRGRPAIVYWLSPTARISNAVLPSLYDVLESLGEQPALDLVLHTGGGDTEAPGRIVSLLREYTDDLAVLVPHVAMSAGTTLAMGANEIIMTPLASLGPIDPSRRHPLLPRKEGAEEPEPVSVQDMRHAMQFIREAPGGTGDLEAQDYTPEAWAQIFEALFDKIHPLAIGAIEQSYALAKRVGNLCLSTHMSSEKKIESIVNQLTDDYKSHSYHISRAEARAIGLNVVDADSDTKEALMGLLKFYSQRPVGPFGPGLKPGSTIKMNIAWLDSPAIRFRVEGDYSVGPNMELQLQGDAWKRY